MKISRAHIQTLVFIAVYLFAIYFWTVPLQARQVPFGEHDAISHFEVADYISYNDRSFIDLPPYIDLRYGLDNKYAPHTLWYPPTFHSSLAVAQVFGHDRIISLFLMNTILATFILVSVYFVVNKLFGWWPAILSAFMLIFSPRDVMPYLWGQWPERFGYAFIPLIMYCFYQYYISFKEGNVKPIYMYLLGLLLALQIMVHPLTFFHSIAAIAVLFGLLWLKFRKIPFKIKHVGIAVGIFLVIFLSFPQQTFNIFSTFNAGVGEERSASGFAFGRIFDWSLDPADYQGSVPATYFSFATMHGQWTLIFLLLGIIYLLIRRKPQDLFMLAWLVSLYLVLHRDVFGVMTFIHRSLSASAHVFIPLTAIGIVYLTYLIRSFVKIPKQIAVYGSVAFVLLAVVFTVNSNMQFAKTLLNENTYDDILATVSHEQFETATWMLENVPKTHNVSVVGLPHQQGLITQTAKKIRWQAAISQRVNKFYRLIEVSVSEPETYLREDYVLVDYTVPLVLAQAQGIDPNLQHFMAAFLAETQQFEQEQLANHTLLYDKNNMRVYRYDG